MRIIKRTKITVVRTETVFLRKQGGALEEIIVHSRSADLTKTIINDSVVEIETINKTEDTEIQGEVK